MNHPLCRIPPLPVEPDPVRALGRELRPERSITRDSDLLLLHHAVGSGQKLYSKTQLNAMKRTSDRLHQLLDTCTWQKENFQCLLWPSPEHIAFTIAAPLTFYRWCRQMNLIKRNEMLDYVQLGDVSWLEFRRLAP